MVEPPLSLFLRCTCVLHQLLAAVKPQVTVLARNVLSFPHAAPTQQQHNFPHKPAVDTCSSSYQQMSATLHVLLEAELSVQGDVAVGAADPAACHQTGQVSVLYYLGGTAGSMDHQHVSLTFLIISCHSGCTG